MKFLTERQFALLDFVKSQHGSQERKYTKEPYWKHLVSVAEIVQKYTTDEFSLEVALCHDLFEDTSCTEFDLSAELLKIGYKHPLAMKIVEGVWALTDVYTSSAYPSINRAERKRTEALRLGSIPAFAQTIKYADLLDNTESIVQYDLSFARVYLREKQQILEQMKNGDTQLYNLCCQKLKLSLAQMRSRTFKTDKNKAQRGFT